MPAPVFIVGANRSGTTLLRLILNAHSALAIPDEISYFYSFRGRTPFHRWRTPGMDRAAYDRFVADFFAANRSVVPELDLDALRRAVVADPIDLRRPYEALLTAWAAHHDKPRWGEKTPGNLFWSDVLIDMFPDARFVHMVRDPRACVASMQRVDFFPSNVVFNALNHRKSLTAGRALLEAHVPTEQRCLVRYEDLVHDPEAVVRAVCTFIDLPFEPAMLAYHERAARYMTPAAARSFNATATRPIAPQRAEAWRDRLSPRDIALVEAISGAVMRPLGYAPDDAPPLPWMARARRLWPQALYWHWQNWRNRHIRHFTVQSPMFARWRQRTHRWKQRLHLART
ncbi:sulfotransferase family protein [Salisaeta longa]|uniref:sulfotransferase family protein n=1 Tax=Salisaeta longa TaxID=503170 RepID=UPI0003B3BDDF|nr:sulfotransferase [Salisaeta longa]